jgi:hypothetical protein
MGAKMLAKRMGRNGHSQGHYISRVLSANHNEIENQQFYLKFQEYVKLVDKTRCLTRDITLTNFEDFLLIM